MLVSNLAAQRLEDDPEGSVSTGAGHENTTTRRRCYHGNVVFELESIDRVYLNVYAPRLQREGFHRRTLLLLSFRGLPPCPYPTRTKFGTLAANYRRIRLFLPA